MIFRQIGFAIGMGLWILSVFGCNYVKMTGHTIRGELVEEINESKFPIVIHGNESGKVPSIVSGTIVGNLAPSHLIAVVAIPADLPSTDKWPGPTYQTVVQGPGPYTLVVAPGNYHIHAFWDRNRDSIIDTREHLGWFGHPDSVTVTSGHMVSGLTISVDVDDPIPWQSRFQIAISNQPIQTRLCLCAGRTVDLSHPMFNASVARTGLWQPARFIGQYGVGIYAPAPYDPDRVPVVFVHGVNGSSRDFRFLSSYVDRRRFQVWFYYYPTGIRLSLASQLLSDHLKNLHQIFGFQRLAIVAHSMGGLVVRGMTMNHGPWFVGKIITLSTPYGGDDNARSALEQAPACVDSWQDVAAGSPFLINLYNCPLPRNIDFHLICSQAGANPLLGEPNDGVVTVASQLFPEIASTATTIRKFDEDHSGILRSRSVALYVSHLLDSDGASATNHTLLSSPMPGTLWIETHPSHARINVLNYPVPSHKPLSLQPGDYLIEVTADGFKRWCQWIHINSGETRQFTVKLKPVTSEGRSTEIDTLAQMADRLRSSDPRKQIQGVRMMLRKQIFHPLLFSIAEAQLATGWYQHLDHRFHVDAMAWMCRLLARSNNPRYIRILEQVAHETTSGKLRRHAQNCLNQLKALIAGQ